MMTWQEIQARAMKIAEDLSSEPTMVGIAILAIITLVNDAVRAAQADKPCTIEELTKRRKGQ